MVSTTNPASLEQVERLAAQLPPQEQLILVAHIGERLSAMLPLTSAQQPLPSSAQAIRQVMHQPPHLSAEDVDELERAIAAGTLPVQQAGTFDAYSECS